MGTDIKHRFSVIQNAVKDQLIQLKNVDMVKAVRKQNDTTYINAQNLTGEELEEITKGSILQKNKETLSKFNKKLKKRPGPESKRP
ncbi:MAG: hypothetical protein ACPGU0_02665 [Marinirhabdus sp.]